MKSSLDIAKETELRPIEDVAEELGLSRDWLELCGGNKA